MPQLQLTSVKHPSNRTTQKATDLLHVPGMRIHSFNVRATRTPTSIPRNQTDDQPRRHDKDADHRRVRRIRFREKPGHPSGDISKSLKQPRRNRLTNSTNPTSVKTNNHKDPIK